MDIPGHNIKIIYMGSVQLKDIKKTWELTQEVFAER